jgi:hypothetical protein
MNGREIPKKLTTDYTDNKKPGAFLLRAVLFGIKSQSAYSAEPTVTLITVPVPDVVLLCDVIGMPT